ncbi:unnamed protein product [Protopolystoma xenopodis]|uniref:Uncharacterized protein n=1 Tax=Protopolystoma xenopodis TaxID=117903 RepID=A0A3S5BMR6_9PLAT|nr:unnamed protein product [Protopolystoma xenopodis]
MVLRHILRDLMLSSGTCILGPWLNLLIRMKQDEPICFVFVEVDIFSYFHPSHSLQEFPSDQYAFLWSRLLLALRHQQLRI